MYAVQNVMVSWMRDIQRNIEGYIMPAMPRMKDKATKIAYKILGVPANIAARKTPEQKEIDRRLSREDTWRAR